MTSPSIDTAATAEKPGHRYLAIAWFHDGRYAWGGAEDRDQALRRCRGAARRDLGVKRSFRANVYDTGGDVVTFDNNVHVYDMAGRDITETGELVEVL
jgi:hypothetical protein